MRKLTIILLLLLAGVTGATAQNANRSGFFFEAGAGGFVGETPRVALQRTQDNELILHFADGVGVNFFFGYRVRISNHWAYECRIGLESPVKYFDPLFSPKALPIGFRYTSGELFRNHSLYAYLNLGGTACEDGEFWDIPNQNETTTYITGGRRFGLVGETGVGLNISSHFYGGIAFSGQYMLGNMYYRIGEKWLKWGTIGIKIGYRI